MNWYLRGSLLFLAGSSFLFAFATSRSEQGVSAIYIAGSVCFIVGTLVEARKQQKRQQ